MRASCYIKFNRDGIVAGGMTVKGKPNLRAGEFAVKINLEVDDEYIDRAIPVVDVDIPEPAMMTPTVEVDTSPEED